MRNNKNLLIVALIALVNALGYGIIIPVLYSYSQKFGLSDFSNGLLYSLFSICQFISAPIIGRLSDKYGRKPLLILSIGGTALSFIMMAFAPSAIWLFIARALDGITSGNIPVASAVISDTTKPEERSRGFGIIGASFGFGFIFGPALSALTLPFGASAPFIIAALVSIIAVILTALILPETNKHLGQIRNDKLFDFSHLYKALFEKTIGKTLLVTFFYAFSFSLYVYAFQPFSIKVMNLHPQDISIIFTLMGVIGVIAQGLIIPKISRKIGEKKALLSALIVMSITFTSLFFNQNYWIFVILISGNSLANSFINPMIQSLLSKEVDVKSQGSIQGINSSYTSLGMILGPIIGGICATYFIPLPFLIGAFILMICIYLGYKILKQPIHAHNIT